MSGEAFEALLAPNLRSVRTLVLAKLGDFDRADDMVQEILLRAFVHRNQLRSRASFKAWLWSIALNEIRAYFRRGRYIVSLEEFPDFDAPDPSPSPLARLEQIERHEWLRARIAELPERDGALILLRDICDATVRESAAALGRSVSATKTAHCRARKRLAHLARACASRPGRLLGRAAA